MVDWAASSSKAENMSEIDWRTGRCALCGGYLVAIPPGKSNMLKAASYGDLVVECLSCGRLSLSIQEQLRFAKEWRQPELKA